MYKNKTLIFAMPNSRQLGNKVAKRMNMQLSPMKRTVFADGEVILQSEHVVRNKDIWVVASTSKPVNENIMELLIFIDSLKRASAKSINVITTYFGYARQDRKAQGRQPITSKLVADLLTQAGATKVALVDVHNPSIQGFFDIPADDLRGAYLFAPVIAKMGKFTVVSPDHGGAVRARKLSELLGNQAGDIAIIDKRRTKPNVAETMGILGDVKDKNCVIIDDMIDTGGTIIKASKVLKEHGAKKVVVAATHGLFSRGFKNFDENANVDQVIVSDSIEAVSSIKSKKIKVQSLAPFIEGTIKASIHGTSISKLYNRFNSLVINQNDK